MQNGRMNTLRPRVYIESSVVSYLTARQSTDPVKATWQAVTREWWKHSLPTVQPFVSAFVLEEVSMGDPSAAAERVKAIDALARLTSSDEVVELADFFLLAGGLPKKARLDALHIACATVHRMDVLLTWNCVHMANPTQLPVVRGLCAARGYRMPEIVTPVQLVSN
jgi:predicted nucleic acid-binding protein